MRYYIRSAPRNKSEKIALFCQTGWFTAEAPVVRKNRNLEVGIVPVGRRVFQSEKTTPHSAVVLIWTFCAAHQPPKFPDFTCYTTFFPFFTTLAPSPPLRVVSSADGSTRGCCRLGKPTTPPSLPCSIRAR